MPTWIELDLWHDSDNPTGRAVRIKKRKYILQSSEEVIRKRKNIPTLVRKLLDRGLCNAKLYREWIKQRGEY